MDELTEATTAGQRSRFSLPRHWRCRRAQGGCTINGTPPARQLIRAVA